MKGDARVQVELAADKAEFFFSRLLQHRGGEPGFRRGIEGLLEAMERHGDPVPDEIRRNLLQQGLDIPAGMFRFIAVGTKIDEVITPEDMKTRMARTFKIEVKAWWIATVAFAVLRTAAANANMSELRKYYLPLAASLGIETQLRKAVGLEGDDHDGDAVELDLPVVAEQAKPN